MITLASQQGTPWTGFNGFGQAAGSAMMLDGTLATPATDSAGSVVGFVGPLLPDGTTNSYDANGNLVATTAAEPPLAAVQHVLSAFSTLVTDVFGSPRPAGSAPQATTPWSTGTWVLLGAGAYLLFFSDGGGGRRRNPQRRLSH
jgi:hypothetical protein